MSARFTVAAALAGPLSALALIASAEAGDYPLVGTTALASENEVADGAAAIKAEIDGMLGDLAKFGATAADFAKADTCFDGFVKAAADGTVISYQLDVGAVEKAMDARHWPVPVAFEEAARTACMYDAKANAETCTDPDASHFALVYFDAAHTEFGFLPDPKDIAATRANPKLVKHNHVIDCSVFAQFLDSHVTAGHVEIRSDVHPLVLGYFVSRLSNDPAFAKAVEAWFAAKQPAGPAARKQ